MSADQRPSYQPKPISQRDGSELANSNCRMASIATGIDFDTHGADRSTGALMRSYCDDQSGGTDSGDARTSWSRGYSESLTVRDGDTFDDLLADLRSGRLVHVDVWHATVGGPCLSGSGGYGHTMAVLPDCSSGSWLVADPWCSPPKWTRVTEAKLRAGADDWGRRVYGRALEDTGGELPPRGTPAWRLLLAAAGKVLMTLRHPGDPDPDPRPTQDTGGSQPILYTATAGLPLIGGSDDMTIALQGTAGDWHGVTGVQVPDGGAWFLDAARTQLGVGNLSAMVVPYVGWTSEASRAVIVGTGVPYDDGPRDTIVYVSSSYALVELPPAPTPPTDVDAAIAARDDAWTDWLLEGSPAVVDPVTD